MPPKFTCTDEGAPINRDRSQQTKRKVVPGARNSNHSSTEKEEPEMMRKRRRRSEVGVEPKTPSENPAESLDTCAQSNFNSNSSKLSK